MREKKEKLQGTIKMRFYEVKRLRDHQQEPNKWTRKIRYITENRDST